MNRTIKDKDESSNPKKDDQSKHPYIKDSTKT